MSTALSFRGTTYQVPIVGEAGWGAQVSNLLIALGILDDKKTDTTLTTLGTLTPVTRFHRIASAAGEITLSATTAIAAGSYTGQKLLLTGTSDTDIVVVPDGANTRLNGDWTSGIGKVLALHWDADLADWIEDGRTP